MIIDTNDFAKLIWDTIQQELNPKTRKLLSRMTYGTKEYEDGFIQGLAWASILSILTKPSGLNEDDSQRVIAALESEGYLSKENEKSYTEVHKPIDVNINDLIKSYIFEYI